MPTMAWFRTWVYAIKETTEERIGNRMQHFEDERDTRRKIENKENKKEQRKKCNMLVERTDQQRKTEKKKKEKHLKD